LALTLKFKATLPPLDIIIAKTCSSQVLQDGESMQFTELLTGLQLYCFSSIFLDQVPGSAAANQGAGFMVAHPPCKLTKIKNSRKTGLWPRRINAVI